MNSNDKSESRSEELFRQAVEVLAGGVSRQMVMRHPHPDYVAAASGCQLTDVDGVTRIDFANNTGSLIHGHAHPDIVRAVTLQLEKGTAFSLANEAELRLAQSLCARNPGFEKIRFMNSGTEAVMAGIKAARAITGRAKIAKCEGCYHGNYDMAEVSQTSTPENWGELSRPNPVSVRSGTAQSALDNVIVFPFNDVERTIAILDQHQDEVACVLIDPLPHRAGLIPATREYITALREWTMVQGALLVMDEVLSFRTNFGGAQEWFDVQPDLTALGKIIGGGFPVGALAGTHDAMQAFESTSSTPVSFSGTFAANPITMTAGQVAMELFDRDAVNQLNELGDFARQRIGEAIQNVGIDAHVTGAGSMFRIYLKPERPTEYRSAYLDEAQAAETKFLVDFLYQHGFVLINTCTAALSTATKRNDIEQFVEAIEKGLQAIMERR